MATITLPIRCDRAAASGLYAELLEASGSNPTTVDGHRVEHICHAVLQVLVSAAKTGEGIVLTNPSEKLQAAVTLSGLGKLLNEAETA